MQIFAADSTKIWFFSHIFHMINFLSITNFWTIFFSSVLILWGKMVHFKIFVKKSIFCGWQAFLFITHFLFSEFLIAKQKKIFFYFYISSLGYGYFFFWFFISFLQKIVADSTQFYLIYFFLHYNMKKTEYYIKYSVIIFKFYNFVRNETFQYKNVWLTLGT